MGKHGLDGRRRNIVGKVGEEIILNVGGRRRKVKGEREDRLRWRWKSRKGEDWKHLFFLRNHGAFVGGERNKEIILFFWRAAPWGWQGTHFPLSRRGPSILGTKIRNGEKWKKITFYGKWRVVSSGKSRDVSFLSPDDFRYGGFLFLPYCIRIDIFVQHFFAALFIARSKLTTYFGMALFLVNNLIP